VASEFEALLLELRTIRTRRPRFNVVHRRDRRFAWVRLTGEPAPRLVATLEPGAGSTRRGARRGERLFGPFPAHRTLPRTLRELASATGLRDCAGHTPIHFADQPDLLGALLPPRLAPRCPRAELGTCPAPCAALCTEASYAERVRKAVAFLEGEGEAPLEQLTLRMEAASERQAFEVAARLRDRIERLVRLRRSLVETTREIESLTFVYHPPPAHPCATPRHFLLREGQVLLDFDPPPPGDRDARAQAAGRIADALDGPATPSALLDAGAREELFLATRWFRLHPEEHTHATPVHRYLAKLGRGRFPGRTWNEGAPPIPDPPERLSPSPAPAHG
jgi:excinuclease ABC subunit C